MKVVIADDDIVTRTLLSRLLGKWDFEAVVTENGRDAWRAIEQLTEPCIALLDWLMPGMSGIDVCRKLDQRVEGPFVYTILLTAKTGEEDKIEGLTAGAHAFICKPFNPDELKSCLRVAQRVLDYEAELREKNRRLRDYADQMEQLAEERARQLVHADRMATLGLLSAGVAHEINNPATFIAGNVQDLEKAWELASPRIRRNPTDSDTIERQLDFVRDEVPKMLAGIREGVERISRITDGLKGYARRGQEAERPFSINDSVRKSLNLCQNALKNSVKAEADLGEELADVLGVAQEIDQVLVNLFVNSAQAMAAQGGGVLRIQTRQINSTIAIEVEDTGPGFSEEALKHLFKPFFTTKKQGEGTGLGLSISEGIIERHHGTIVASNASNGGARFVISMPAYVAKREKNNQSKTSIQGRTHEKTIAHSG